MLYKEDIITIVKDMNLPANDYWISSGAALVIHGVKEFTKDIDLGCTEKLWDYLLQNGYSYRVEKDNSNIISINDNVEIIKNWFVDEKEFIEELPIASLESIKNQKYKLGREKDFKDIETIDEFIISRR
ncbi:MAG: hypothetical protein Q8936_13565 [Bacillota bacterium]|nr:hypothetical protein [Bacillota bacterium]